MATEDTRRVTIPIQWSEAARQEAVESLGLLDTPPEERFDLITRLCADVFGVPRAVVSLIDRDRQFHKSEVGVGLSELPRQDSFCAEVIRSSQMVVVQDATADPRFRDKPMVTGPEHVRFWAGVPLAGPDGQLVGALCVEDTRPRVFGDRERGILRELGSMAAAQLMLRAEVGRAEQVQSQLLPHTKPELPGFDIAATCRPSRRISGDFYDWYCLLGELTLTLADVMGKGVASAIIAATLRGVLRSETRRTGLTAALPATHQALRDDLDATGMLVTLFHARLDVDGLLRYIDAGHGLAVIARQAGHLDRLSVRGLPLGVSEYSAWRVGIERLAPGDTLVVFSDGLLDAYQGLDATLASVLVAAVREASAEAVLDRLVSRTFSVPRTDDVTVMVARRKEAT